MKDKKAKRTKKENKVKKLKTRGKSKKILKRISLFILFVIVVVALIYILLEIGGDKNPMKDFIFNAFKIETMSEEKFSFEAYSDNIFEELDGGMLIVSGSQYQLFGSDGELIASDMRAFSHPAISAGESGAVVWGSGGTEAMLISSSGKSSTVTTQGAIISASVNDNGYLALASEESGYKGIVTVYNAAAKPVYKWYSGAGYLISAAVSPSDSVMAAVSVTDTGSRIVTYSLSSEEEQGSYTAADEICFDMGYISDNRICVISENKAVFLNGRCEYNSEYSFTGQYLRDYSFDGNGFAVFVLGRYRVGGGEEIVAVDGSGKVIGRLEISANVKSLSVRGRYIALVYSDKAVLYNSSFDEIGVVEDAAGIERALAKADGKLIAVSAYRADEYKY